MPRSLGETTAPGAPSTLDDGSSVPSFALEIIWSAEQMHRVCELAFFAFGQKLFVGRGDIGDDIDDFEDFAHFVRQLPGETPAVDPHEELLGGKSISRRQLAVIATAEGLEVEKIGACRTFFNGEERKRALMKPGDTVRLKGELVLLCVQRPRTLPGLRTLRVLQPFGEPDRVGIVGEGPGAWALRDQLATAAASDDPLLIRGESGTGKELAVKAVRSQSPRANGPYVSRNSGTFTDTLLASELFGNPADYPNKGMRARPGLFGAADGGILYLDEIGDLSLEAQTELLRVLDEGEYQAVGETKMRRANVRLIGATNRDDSHFRPDFLARFPARIRIPPLRERREDIPLLIRHLLIQRANKSPKPAQTFLRAGKDGRLEPRISGRLVEHLVRHPLPLNVRDLGRLLGEAINASTGDVVMMPAEEGTPATPPPREGKAKGSVPSKADVESCLDRERWNVARVARALGVGRTALYRLMQKYGVKKRQVE